MQQNILVSYKLLRSPKTFCLRVSGVLIFTMLEIQTENILRDENKGDIIRHYVDTGELHHTLQRECQWEGK